MVFADASGCGPIDGVALSRILADRWPEMAVVVCSGAPGSRRALLPDRARLIAKPFSHAQVVAVAQELLAA